MHSLLMVMLRSTPSLLIRSLQAVGMIQLTTNNLGNFASTKIGLHQNNNNNKKKSGLRQTIFLTELQKYIT